MASLFDDSEFGNYDYSNTDTSGDLGGYDQIGGDGGSFSYDDSAWNPIDYSGSFGPQEQQFDYQASIPQGTFGMPQAEQFGFGGDGVGIQPSSEYATGGFDLGSIAPALQNLFSGQQGKGALSGLGALIEGMQNKKKASSIQNIVNQQQARTDPFGAQRPFYQQQLQSTVQNPYTQPMVRDQVAQIQRAQAIKDAAAGRRSNSATSSPAMLAAQAAVAQQYMNSLMTPAGANIAPNGGGLEALLQGNAANVHGYASPIMSALGYNQQTNSNQAQIDALRKLLTGGQ